MAKFTSMEEVVDRLRVALAFSDASIIEAIYFNSFIDRLSSNFAIFDTQSFRLPIPPVKFMYEGYFDDAFVKFHTNQTHIWICVKSPSLEAVNGDLFIGMNCFNTDTKVEYHIGADIPDKWLL